MPSTQGADCRSTYVHAVGDKLRQLVIFFKWKIMMTTFSQMVEICIYDYKI